MPNLRPENRQQQQQEQPKPAPKKKRPMPPRMSEEEEKGRYARVFKGCGKREDYNMTTKLGEGTFGCVTIILTCTWHLIPPSPYFSF
jgi:hypothetical protein